MTSEWSSDLSVLPNYELRIISYGFKISSYFPIFENVLSAPVSLTRSEPSSFVVDAVQERSAVPLTVCTVTDAALAGKDPVCVETLERFASLYGAEAGNIALKCLAVGGVLVGGGIAPKILPVLQGHLPKVALNPRAPLIGAALCRVPSL